MPGSRGATAAKLTAGGAALVLVAGISIVALDAPGSHADYLALFGRPQLARAAERGRMLTT